MSTNLPTRPRVFFDVQSGSDFLGRITIELFSDKAPKTAENFRAICTPPSSAQPLSYKGSRFHRIIDEFMVQGGDITAGNGTGGMSIYGPMFEDENIGWREIDAAGLVCMANRGKGTNSSQFFITLAPCQHLNMKHTIFGHVIKGMDVCERMAKVPVDSGDRPLSEVAISHCGELERKLKPDPAPRFPSERSGRGRFHAGETRNKAAKRSRSTSRPAKSMSHSRSPSRHRRQRERSIPTRRRSDTWLDENRRGRTATRSVSPHDHSPQSPPRKRRHRRRSSPPSRSRSPKRSTSPHLRRRSTDRDRPPKFDGIKEEERDRMDGGHWNRRPNRRIARSHGGNGYGSREHPRDDHGHGRLDDDIFDGGDGSSGGGKEDNVVKFKGRGSMKYQEPKAW
ncbi:MAG: hypothetical protein Q9171_003322 [Xanthocarpia ochracea]